jgi:DNA-binding MarR family transcriptional regulator/N-acetylglutamate synthase-like GNAT family acetyltransferase
MADGIAELRLFNRFYTQRIGVLTDRYLGQDRPLAEARLLFEIGSDGSSVHALRERLGLDSGYLSRMLRSLERSGLVETVAAGGPDARRRLARPTPAGQAELAEINRRSDAAMARVVEGLDEPQLQELVTALATVERLLGHDASDRAGRPVIRRAQAGDAAAIAGVLRRAFAEQEPAFTPDAFAVSTPDPATVVARIATDPVWVAEQDRRVVGTVSAAPRPPSLFVRSLAVLPEARGSGLANLLLAEAERCARRLGLDRLELDTTPFQSAAARVYERFGFRPGHRHDLHGTAMIRMVRPISSSTRGRSRTGASPRRHG